METRRALLVDAFADEPLSGNPAGVVPDAAGLTEDQMRAVASELGASETAFVRPGDGDESRAVRYFTPEEEVDLCGHATIATYAALSERGAIDPGEHTAQTAAGDLTVEVGEDGQIWMEQAAAEVEAVDLDHTDAADALGIDVAALRDVGADLPLARASTGFPLLLVPVNYFEHLRDADPDLRAIENLCERADVRGLYAFTFDALDRESTLHARMFAPLAGVPEDPVTGTGAGACGAYLRRHGALDGEFDEIVVEQGHLLDRPGTVRVETDGRDVRVGGRAVTAMEGEITVPDEDDDDIVVA
ncbi:PhzF family phenazine biosynthesis protein [Halomicrobium salinisoli]|uniref:PhzF family phenazine biosynthesis protein n=1 Tax=Halomicrobium salinisoli TaxID=2878391 RepID=UPI001CF00C24|nr:PhzF family phenazine biosynthesis protein [Halomicrobium salinisoli]